MKTSAIFIVDKPFRGVHEESLSPGTPIDTRNFRDTRYLLKSGLVRKPNSIEDWEIIQEYIRCHEDSSSLLGGDS